MPALNNICHFKELTVGIKDKEGISTGVGRLETVKLIRLLDTTGYRRIQHSENDQMCSMSHQNNTYKYIYSWCCVGTQVLSS